MKAKELASQIRRSSNKAEAVAAACIDCVREVNDIAAMRHAKRTGAVVSILREQNDKWRAVSRLVPEVRPDSFEQSVRIAMPAVYESWTGRAADAA